MKSYGSIMKMLSCIAFGLFLFTGLLSRGNTYAATLQAISPFQVTGFIEQATLDSACRTDVTCGGTLTVNGTQITVPKNTLLQMPAFALTWQELFKLAPSSTVPASLGCASTGLPCSTGPYGMGSGLLGADQTGLALSDIPTPLASYEVTVIGNRVSDGANDRYLAAFIFISQQALKVGQGFINYIDYAKGELWVSSSPLGSTSPQIKARVRINTPSGRFGSAQSHDQRFTSDEDNPTIHAQTGYPMCIPRTDPTVSIDPLCPQKNRPMDPITGGFQTIFTIPAPIVDPGTGLNIQIPDSTQQAPFEINDYIDYSGTLVKDADPLCVPSALNNNCLYISAHTINANLGIFTAPGSMPAYLNIEEMLLGIGGIPNPLFPQEAVEKLRVTAFSTDPTQLVDIYAIDVDSCGHQSDRYYGTADPFGPPVGGLKGRARLRTTIGNFLPATREMRVVSRTLTGGQVSGSALDTLLTTAKRYANGLIAGQYHAPNFTFIFPESLIIGSPPVPMPFQEFPFLVNGSGPYFGAGSNASATALGNLSQLNPWPGLVSPAPPTGCSLGTVISAPVANAGPSQTVNSGASVILNGTGSFDTNNPTLPLNYTWLQSGGPTLPNPPGLQDPGFPSAFFTAPPVTVPTVLTFSLAVDNGFTSSAISTTSVTVVPLGAPVITMSADQQVNSGLSPVRISGSAIDPSTPLSFQWTQTAPATPQLTLTVTNTATSSTATFSAPALTPIQPPFTFTFQLKVTDAAGFSSTGITNVTVKPPLDTVNITNATWRRAKSRLDVTATSNASSINTPNTGQPQLTLHVAGIPDVVMIYASATNTYTATVTTTSPTSVTVTSSFGGTATSTVAIK
ncbi:MAG: hypothetical protein LAO31_17655 [Acidobacteriia bacterium]|nr:hypothetical protein [Terriglobia bacterium]